MMVVFRDPQGWRAQRHADRRAGVTLGFVPTMGALHRGHISLVERSRRENDRTLVSIFVNPSQFNDPADLAAYPETLDEDLDMLRTAGADFVLCPAADDVYRDGYRYRVVETVDSRTLEGSHRPGHFDGVLTVVLKLLLLASAERAYFGEKDWQQLQLVSGMADAFFLDTTVVPCPTVREADGLAYSSRNARLSPAQRQHASLLYASLTGAPTAAEAARRLHAAGFVVDYVEDRGRRRLAAVRLGDVRLIDNVAIEGSGDSRA